MGPFARLQRSLRWAVEAAVGCGVVVLVLVGGRAVGCGCGADFVGCGTVVGAVLVVCGTVVGTVLVSGGTVVGTVLVGGGTVVGVVGVILSLIPTYS